MWSRERRVHSLRARQFSSPNGGYARVCANTGTTCIWTHGRMDADAEQEDRVANAKRENRNKQNGNKRSCSELHGGIVLHVKYGTTLQGWWTEQLFVNRRPHGALFWTSHLCNRAQLTRNELSADTHPSTLCIISEHKTRSNDYYAHTFDWRTYTHQPTVGLFQTFERVSIMFDAHS